MSVTVPWLLKVTGMGVLEVPTFWFKKVTPIGSVILVPIPESATVCGLPGALSVTDKVPVAKPTVVGWKVT